MNSPADTLKPQAVLHSPEAEMALLGGLISYPEQIPQVDGVEAAIHDARHKVIFDTLAAMHAAGEEIDAVHLKARLELWGHIQAAGGIEYLFRILDSCGRPQAAAEYAAIIREYAHRRTAYTAAQRYLSALGRGHVDGEAQALREILDDSTTESQGEPRTLIEARVEAEEMKRIPRVSSSVPGIDAMIGGGYLPRWTVIFGAFSGGGKTMLIVREAIHQAQHGHPVLVVSLELSVPELTGRIDWALDDPAQELPIWLWSETCDLDTISRTIHRWVKAVRISSPDRPTPIVCLDYIQLVQASKQPTREREVAIAVQTLQRSARKNQYILISAAQFNRQSQAEERPQLHHLRESGQIEQSADLALLVAKDGDDRIWIKIGKSRWSGTGKELDLACDYARCVMQPIGNIQKYSGLAGDVVQYLRSSGGKGKIRDMCPVLKFNGKHPKKHDLLEASKACGGFKICGPDIEIGGLTNG